ncbi:hypothetical protein Q8F55_006644 [Vanrija albida]|uniref:S-adenosyl-L-methionine-dependent methyltransferase n=1 Tax=Vanrija albida TaxID=181172 RepID=A0ABR3PYJ4_9TREE
MSHAINPAFPSTVNDVDKYGDAWEDKWANNTTPWDQAHSHPALIKLLDSGEGGVPAKGRAFVPGCGLGYDVDTFARRGLDSTGLDIAATGVAAANKWLAEQPPRANAATVELGDFFTYDPGHKFDVIYDYTFLCALPPAMRTKWAESMARLAKADPSARLITQQYPLNGDPVGPPFPLSVEIYDDLLGKDWEVVWERDIPQEERRVNSPPGDERLVVWARKA